MIEARNSEGIQGAGAINGGGGGFWVRGDEGNLEKKSTEL